MEVRMSTKATTSEPLIGENKVNRAVNILFSPRAVETVIGDSPQEGTSRKPSLPVDQIESGKSESAQVEISPENEEDETQNQDSGCGDVQEEIVKRELPEEDVLEKETSSESDQDELIGGDDDLEGNEITWKWEEALQDDMGKSGIKCVDLYEVESDHQEGGTEEGNVVYRSTPVLELMNDDNKDYSDISSEVPEDFDVSAEACCHHVHHPSLLSTSIEDEDEDEDDDDENINGFHSRHYKRANLSDSRNLIEDNDFDDFGEEDANDPELKLWLRRKFQNPSTDNSAHSDSIEEELMRLELQGSRTVTVADKEVQVCEDDFLSNDRNGLELARLSKWLEEAPALEVISQVSRHTQTTSSFLRGGEVPKPAELSSSELQRLAAGDDGLTDSPVPSDDNSTQISTKDDTKESGIAEKTDEEGRKDAVRDQSEDAEDQDAADMMPEHLEKLLSSLHDIPPVPSEDGSCNMWMIPAEDANGTCMNVVLDNGDMYDIFIFRPSCPMTSVSTQTIEEEFNMMDYPDLVDPYSETPASSTEIC